LKAEVLQTRNKST